MENKNKRRSEQLIERSTRSQMFFKIAVLNIFVKFTGKHLCQRLVFNNIAGLKQRLLHRCFPVNFAKILITTFLCNCNHNGIISNLIKSTDNLQHSSINEKVNHQVKNSKLHVINNDNFKNKQLGKRGLNLNTRDNVFVASNVLHATENPE